MMLSLLVALALSAPAPSPILQKRVEGIGVVHVYNDGGSYGVSVDGGTGGGTTYVGDAGISVVGATIACVAATATRGGCLTTVDQDLQGDKTLKGVTIMEKYFSAGGSLTWNGRSTGGFVTNDLVLGGFLRSQNDDTGLTFSSRRSVMTNSPDFIFRPENKRDAGSAIAVVDEAASEYFSVGNDGKMTLGCTTNGDRSLSCGGIWDGYGASGHVMLHSADGLYLTMEGRMPLAYWGSHGAITMRNERPMIAGYIAEFANIGNGAVTEKLMVNYQGGLTQFGGYSYNNDTPFLAPCDGASDHPVDDGGPGYYVAVDAGQAAPGTQMWVADMKRWCYCEPTTRMDGGPRSGWKRYDGQGCNVP